MHVARRAIGGKDVTSRPMIPFLDDGGARQVDTPHLPADSLGRYAQNIGTCNNELE
jgi:hypothetical protein